VKASSKESELFAKSVDEPVVSENHQGNAYVRLILIECRIL